MPDRTRFFLSIFMFAILAFNPLGFLLPTQFGGSGGAGVGAPAAGGDYGEAHSGARSLLFKFSDDAPGWYPKQILYMNNNKPLSVKLS